MITSRQEVLKGAMKAGFDNSGRDAEPPSRQTRWSVISVLALLHLGLASAIALIPFGGKDHYYGNRPVIGLILGTIFAQLSLTGAWCALGPGRFFLRVPLSVLAASIAGLAMAAFIFNSSEGNEFWMFAALTLVGWLLLQPPLWIVSRVFKYMVRLPEQPSDEHAAQFTLAQMLLWTLGVALLLGIGRIALRDFQISPSRYWRGADLRIMLVLMGLNFVLAMPVILTVLRCKASPFVLLIVAAWSLMLGVMEYVCLKLIGDIEQDAVVLILLMNVIHGTLLGSSLTALTFLGYRLRHDREVLRIASSEHKRPGPDPQASGPKLPAP